MTDIKQKALALVNECGGDHPFFDDRWGTVGRALCRAIEQHEAFKQEVSDLVADYVGYVPPDAPCHPIVGLIIPKTDPLVEAMIECGFGDSSNAADDIRAALAARGLEIREKQP